MMYLKFMVHAMDHTQRERMVCTNHYYTAIDDKGIRVYYEDGMWLRVGLKDWLNCFVMGESGKTVDVIHAK